MFLEWEIKSNKKKFDINIKVNKIVISMLQQ